MNDFKFVSEEYSIHNSKNYSLSIQLNKDGFSVLVSGEGNKILTIIHRQTGSLENTRKVFKNEEDYIKLRELSFKSFSILINTNQVSIYPGENITSAGPENLFKLEFEDQTGSYLKTSELESFKGITVFRISHEIDEFINSFRNDPEIRHLTSQFLNYISLRKPENKNSVFIYTCPGIIHLAYLFFDDLKFYNSFSGKNNDELLYHLMNSLRQLNLPPDSGIFYSGHLRQNDHSWKILNKYLPELKILPNEFNFELAWDVNENYFSYLLNELGANN
jgi:hypothetical protein